MMDARNWVRMVLVSGLALVAPVGVGLALAHPQVVLAQPAEGASVAKVNKVALSFSEPLVAAASGIEVVMTAMPGMENHAAMKMTGVRVSLTADGKTLVADLARVLPVGSYEARWHGVGADQHPVAGKLSFTVK